VETEVKKTPEQPDRSEQQSTHPVDICPCCGTAIATPSTKAGFKRWRRFRLGLTAAAAVSFVAAIVIWCFWSIAAFYPLHFLALGILISTNLLAMPKANGPDGRDQVSGVGD